MIPHTPPHTHLDTAEAKVLRNDIYLLQAKCSTSLILLYKTNKQTPTLITGTRSEKHRVIEEWERGTLGAAEGLREVAGLPGAQCACLSVRAAQDPCHMGRGHAPAGRLCSSLAL